MARFPGGNTLMTIPLPTSELVHCPDCDRVGWLPSDTVAWWCAAADEVSVFAQHLSDQLAAPGAHLAEVGDGSPPQVVVFVSGAAG